MWDCGLALNIFLENPNYRYPRKTELTASVAHLP
jgi:hypothetical protein